MARPPAGRDAHLLSPGPKRILAIDGGGVRGIVALAFLERIERILAERHGTDIRLCDYFDLIGGTSTGAIIAAGLAIGLPVGELIELYRTLAVQGFRPRRILGGWLVPRFHTEPLQAQFERQLRDTTLGSERVRTGLAIVSKRIDTGSVWVFHNHPRGPYFDPAGRDPEAVPNKDLLLSQLLRASTAAPTFFAPETIEVARGLRGTFVDGGVSPHNNPALLLFLLATLQGYGFRWPTGADRLLLASVGTGHRPLSPTQMPGAGALPVQLAVLALRSVIDDASWLGQAMLQLLGRSPAPWAIDGEVGDLGTDQLGPAAALHYLRYDVTFTRAALAALLGTAPSEKEIGLLAHMDNVAAIPELLAIARHAAAAQLRAEHFPPEFDVPAA